MKPLITRHVLVWGVILTSLGLFATFSQGAGPRHVVPDDDSKLGRATAMSRLRANATRHRIVDVYSKLPLTFEPNRGQTNPHVKFVSRGHGYSLFLTATESVLVLENAEQRATVRFKLVGAGRNVTLVGRDQLPGRVNYFRGNDPTAWRTDIPTYAKVEYEEVYPGIDLIYYGSQGALEYDLVVAPGADAGVIRLAFEGIDRLDIDAQGDLVLSTAAGMVRQRQPVIYQDVDGVRKVIAGGYRLLKRRNARRPQIAFDVAEYDRSRPLIIDPTLVYASYLGGGGDDRAFRVAADAAGNAYVIGMTASLSALLTFPTTLDAFDTTPGNSVLPGDVFVTKVRSDGSALDYSTFLGPMGSIFAGLVGRLGQPRHLGIAVDATGNAYVTGNTASADFPITLGAFDTSFGGNLDAFVTKVNPTGNALVYSTFLGDTSGDVGRGIGVDGAGNAYVTGSTTSANFPTTGGAFDTSYSGNQDVFVTKVNAAGSALVYSTFLGGGGLDFVGNDEGLGIAVNLAGNAFVTGLTRSSQFPTTAGAFDTSINGDQDAFVTKVNPAGSALVYSTFLGGSAVDQGFGVAVDAAGNAYVTGLTESANFPTTLGAFDTVLRSTDGFVTKINAGGTGLIYSTLLGGSSQDQGFAIAVDAAGNAYVAGSTLSADFPTTAGASFNGGVDAFLTMVNAAGSALEDSMLLGGLGRDDGFDIAMDGAGNLYVAGTSFSTPTFPTTPGAFDPTYNGSADAFIVKFASVADVSLTKADSPDPVITGSNLAYTITVTNNGPGAAANVTVTDSLPAETTFVSCSATGVGVCSGTGNNRTVTFAALASGARETIALIAKVTCDVANGLPIYNTASVTATAPVDPNTINNTQMVTTMASNPGPAITGMAVDKAVLWPPNRQMVEVTVSYTTTDNCPAPANACTLTVRSNEPVNGTGDQTPDWEIVDATHVRLRAERAGTGNGRTYTITITCVDSAGNSSMQTVTVTVPRTQGK